MIFTLVRVFRNESLTRQSNGANHGHTDVHFSEPSGIRETTIEMSGRRSSLTPDRVVWFRILAGDIVLCSWARHFTLTVSAMD